MMDMVERYLAAVAAFLPRSQRDDIRAELRDQIMSQIESREGDIGRPLTRDETEALLKAFGNPIVVSGRYGRNHQLIGPETYPFYRVAIVVTLAIVAAVHLAILCFHAAIQDNPGPAIVDTLGSLWFTSVYLFGIFTGVAVIIDRVGVARYLVDAWRPRDLPPPNQNRRGPVTIIAETVVSILMAVWLLSFNPTVPFDLQGGLQLHWAPVMEAVRRISIIYLFGVAFVNSFALVRPDQKTLVGVTQVAIKAGFLGLTIWWMRQGDIVTVTGLPASTTEGVNTWVDMGVGIGFYVTLAIAAIDLAWEIQRHFRGAKKSQNLVMAL